MVNLSGLSPTTVSLSNSSSAVASLQHAASSVISNQSDTVSVVAMSPTSSMLTSLKDPDNVSETVQSTIQIQLQDAVQQLAPEPSLRGAQGTIQIQLQDAVQQLAPESSLGGDQGAIRIQLQDAVQQLTPESSLGGDQGAISLLSAISLPGPGSRVFHTSVGASSVRADLSGLGKKSPMFPITAGDGLGQGKDSELDVIDSMDISPPSISSVTSSVVPTSFVLTSSPLTLRDPTTGAHFIQNQLLQDDPPDDTDISFPLVASASTSNQSSMHGVLPVSSILGDADNCPVSTATDFLGSDGSFEESTINLQDLA